MANNKISEGGRLIVVAATAKTSGAVEVNGGDTIGIVADTVANGAVYGVHIDGEWELAKNTGVTLTAGEDVYWDGTELTTVATSNTRIGVASKAATTTASRGRILLNHPNVLLAPQT
jgi:predicted RecA/RadA family phage recombinase